MQVILLFFTISSDFIKDQIFVSCKYFIISQRPPFKQMGVVAYSITKDPLAFKKQNEIR